MKRKADEVGRGRPTVELANDVASLEVDIAGGSLAAFRLHDGVNPLSWDSAVHDGNDPSSWMPRPLGHFLCCDRWGPPSEAEEANGMGYHGEASCTQWNVLARSGSQSASMSASLKLAGLEVSRDVRLEEKSAVAIVSEAVKNVKKLGRVYNMVQHPSIAAPFLHAGTLVDCNGKRGFAQGPNRTFSSSPSEPTFNFPKTMNRAGEAADARHMTGGDDDVQSYEVDPQAAFGWVTATSAEHGLVFGYIWPKADYPWISLWCCSRDGKPAARGIEFGTTGLHQPFQILSQHPRLFNLPTFEYVDAGESCKRSYACFLVEVPKDFAGVEDVQQLEGILQVKEHGSDRKFSVPLSGKLF